MKFVIKPYESVGPIKLGMTKEGIRRVMPEEPEDDHYFRGPYTDHFVQMSFFAYYTGEDGVCEAIEFSDPSIAILEGKPINEVPFIEAKNWLEKFDPELKEERFEGVTSNKLGVGLYAPNYYDDEDPTIPVEAVIVFRKGYYD
ncbi:hypothetical protein NSQ62_01455 [Solibacillus sp. FSL H8-0523]|uniref:hypothetical protein n=1 Tax=Solibacillus sp. FSL H8-0523 TaxID=2954511 RepID=UPI003100ED8F